MPLGRHDRPDASQDESDTTLDFPSADAFSLLGNETRLKVLSVLHDPSNETPMEFSVLYEKIGAEFTSGFNYHLDQLVPRFVSKSENGYDLTTFGQRVARAIAGGTFTCHHELDWFPIDGDCIACDGRSLWASYEDEIFRIQCRGCEERILSIQVPPNLVRDRDTDTLVDAIDEWLHNWMKMSVSLARHGICEYCGGTSVSSIVDDVTAYDRISVLLRFDCRNCGEVRRATVGTLASQHPDVKTFHARRGASLIDRRYWEVEQWMSDTDLSILSQDPWRFRVSFSAGGHTCDVTVDETPNVTDVTIDQ